MELLALPLAIIIVAMPVLWNGIDYYNSGKHCVGANVQVGDRVQTQDGRQLTVVEVEGSSMFCKNPELPVKAILDKGEVK
jgi:hypothetical protein